MSIAKSKATINLNKPYVIRKPCDKMWKPK